MVDSDRTVLEYKSIHCLQTKGGVKDKLRQFTRAPKNRRSSFGEKMFSQKKALAVVESKSHLL